MNTQQLLNRLDKAWTELNVSFSGLTDTQMTTAGVIGDWSVKDILAHIIAWEEEALKYLPLIAQGKRPLRYSVTYGGIDAFNTLVVEKNKEKPMPEVLSQLHETHDRLLEYIRSAPDEQITRETSFRRRLRLDTYSHYPEHTKSIKQWRYHLS